MRFNRSTRRNKVMMNGPRTKRPPVFKPEVPGLDDDDDDDNRKGDMGIVASSFRDATSASTSRLKNSNEKGPEPVNSLTLNKGKSIASSSSSHGSSRVVSSFFVAAYLTQSFFIYFFKN
jgi:hypothetical protein